MKSVPAAITEIPRFARNDKRLLSGHGLSFRAQRGIFNLLAFALCLVFCFSQDLRAPLDPVVPSRLLTGVRQNGYIEYRVEFPSAYASRYPANNTVHAWWLVPTNGGGRYPAVVLLHSLGIRRPELEMGLARELVRHGIAVFLMTLPYHMNRTPPGHGSGDMILTGDIPLLREAAIQATWDVRRAFDWLQRQPETDPDRIALVGISLGAILGATALAPEPRVHSAVLILGGADLAHVLWDSILAIRARARLRREGYTLERLREELAPVEPLNLLSLEHGAKTFVIGARFDIVVPTEDTEKLIRALGNPKVFWLNTGHFGGGLVQRPLFRMVRQYLQARFEGQTPANTPTILAPTLRIGAIYSAGRDFRLALGTDFWRSDKNGSLFVSGILTPRGGSLFVGARLRLGFSAGVEITPKRAYGAIFWHFVL
ncbi:MAG: alpha/beta hydrolase family protein, partial [Fimbriimonadales bacterium]|nr:alpha/beta hydrolase family protein [Fimbriimonadales bacterium]